VKKKRKKIHVGLMVEKKGGLDSRSHIVKKKKLDFSDLVKKS